MPVNRPLPAMRDRPTAMPEASRWMLSGSSAVVPTRSMRPRSIGSTIPLFSPRMRRRLAAAHVGVLHLEREQSSV